MTRSTSLPDESCQVHVDQRGYVTFIVFYFVYRGAVPVLYLLVVRWAAPRGYYPFYTIAPHFPLHYRDSSKFVRGSG